MAIFILSAPLLKCSEPWNWLLWHFEQNHTIQVSGPDSPEQGGMIYISHFWFCPHRACVALQGQVGRQVCWPPPPCGTHFPWPQRLHVGEVTDGLLGAWPFRNFVLLWPWNAGWGHPPITHHVPLGFGLQDAAHTFLTPTKPLCMVTSYLLLSLSKPTCSYPQKEE